MIGDVRGMGLYVGVEFVLNRFLFFRTFCFFLFLIFFAEKLWNQPKMKLYLLSIL